MALALFRRDAGRGRFFDDFLMATLQRAVALAEMHHVAVVVGEHLDLDVTRLFEELLHVDLGVAERGQRFGLRHVDRVDQRRITVHDAHAAAAAAAGSFDDDGIAELARDPEVLIGIGAERTARAGHARHAGRFHHADGRHFVAHHANGFGLGADENETALLDALGEVRVLGQEAVAGMDRDRIGHFRGADDRRHVQIAVFGCRRADAHRFIREQHVLLVEVGWWNAQRRF